MVIDIKSGNINWDGGAQGYKGLLFRIDDEELAVPFRGKGSKKFNYSGTDYRIIVAAEPMGAVVSIELGSGRDNFYEDIATNTNKGNFQSIRIYGLLK